jgi:HAMP domain-containing protein
MTDEERKKLCETLRGLNTTWPWPEITIPAAEEIERLAAEVERLKQERDSAITRSIARQLRGHV